MRRPPIPIFGTKRRSANGSCWISAPPTGLSDCRSAHNRHGYTFADIDLRWSEPIGRSCMHVRNRLNFCRGRGILRGPGKVNALSGTHPGAYIKPLDVAW